MDLSTFQRAATTDIYPGSTVYSVCDGKVVRGTILAVVWGGGVNVKWQDPMQNSCLAFSNLMVKKD